MFSAILEELVILTKEPVLQGIVGKCAVAVSAILSLQMYLTDDITAGYKAISAVLLGIFFILASYIEKSATSLQKLRFALLAIGASGFIAFQLIADVPGLVASLL